MTTNSCTGLFHSGASYEYVDTDVKNRKTYYYKLEDIDVNGVATFHGPMSATPGCYSDSSNERASNGSLKTHLYKRRTVMKKFIALYYRYSFKACLWVFLSVTCFIILPSSAFAAQYGDYVYSVSNGTVIIDQISVLVEML